MKKYSFQIIPPHTGKIKQLRLDSKKLRVILVCIALLILINFVALGFNIFFTSRAINRASVTNENQELRTQLALSELRADSLSLMLNNLSDLNRQLRHIADLPPVAETEYSYGIGGPELDYHDPSEPAIFRKSRAINEKLDSLILAAKTENEYLAETREKIEENKDILGHTPSIWPMHGYISSGFGKRLDPFTGIWKMHEGIDICAAKGTPVRATADGRVRFAGWYHGYGKTIKLNHTYYNTRYAHLDEIKVRPGQKVKRGDIIGTCGRSGYTTGVHLHYEVRVSGKPVDPKKYLYPDVVVD